MPKNQIYYWQVPMPEWDFPVRITERTNQKIDITTSDWSLHWHESLEFQLILQGAITLSCNGQTETLHPGDVFFRQLVHSPTMPLVLPMAHTTMCCR